MRINPTTLMLVLAPVAAFAGAIPRYDTELRCQRLAEIGGESDAPYNSCIDKERRSYNNIKMMWNETPASAQTYCDRTARTGGGSYSLLESCLSMESDAARGRPPFRN